MSNKKQVGIWLDYREAYVIELPSSRGDAPTIKHLRSDIVPGVPKGGSRSKTPWGPQAGPSENGFEDRRHREEKAYFEKVIHEVAPDTNELVIFGPAEAKFGLQNAIEAIKHYHPRLLGVFPADSMTENQIVAGIKEYFGEN